MGLIFGALLAIAAKLFAVEKDERVPKITEVLPGANCGGCGYAGCGAYAEAVAAGLADVSCCSVGGAAVAEKIGEIMGVSAEKAERKTAYVMCSGTKTLAADRYINEGAIDCHAANRLAGGMKGCAFGCLGLGSCAERCRFDAIHVEDGVARVDREKCVNCGACIAECPRGIIRSVPYDAEAVNACSSRAAGKTVRAVCGIGCIGCGICARNCPAGAIEVKDNLAVIDPKKCEGCGICAEKCPRKVIRFAKNEEPVIQVARYASR